MTLLLCSQDSESMVIVTDTLAIHPVTRQPVDFLNKCAIFEEPGMAVSCTGSGNLFVEWTKTLERESYSELDQASLFAEQTLGDIEVAIRSNGSVEDAGSSTMYHFGYSAEHRRFVTHKFRSINGYRREVISSDSIWIKPDHSGLLRTAVGEDLANWAIEVAENMKQIDSTLPLVEQVGIGGQLVMTVLMRNTIIQRQIYEFAT